MNMSGDIRVKTDRKYRNLYNDLKNFAVGDMHELFFLCSCLGFRAKKKKSLGSNGEDRFWSRTITPEARMWLVSLACQKPKKLGYSYELWTNRLLAVHARKYCKKAGHPSLAHINRGTVSKILQKSGVRPHKISYYLERRDPDFDRKMAQVLHIYKEVELIKQNHCCPKKKE